MARLERTLSPSGLVLLVLRTSRGWTQEALASRSQTSTSAVTAWENGTRTLAEDLLLRLADTMGYDPIHVGAALFGLTPVIEAVIFPPPESEPADLPRHTLPAARLEALGQILPEMRERERRHREEARTRWHQQARAEADALVRRLQPLPAVRREDALQQLVVAGAPRWALIERLCAQSQSEITEDAKGALAWAQLALRNATASSPRAVDRMAGYVYAFLADAHRALGDWNRAEGEFLWARDLWALGAAASELPLREWWRFELEARLRREQGRTGRALGLQAKALQLAPPEESPALLGSRAETLLAAGDESAAMEALRQALRHLPESRDPRLRLAFELRLADLFTRNGRFQEAAQLLPGARRRAELLRSLADLDRVLWMKARIDAARPEADSRARARTVYEQLRADFSRWEMPCAAAEVSLELAALLIEVGETARLRHLPAAVAWIATTSGLPRAASIALRALEATPDQEKPLAWVQAALAELRRPPAFGSLPALP